jgi:AraC family L-rhamnose operon regulatory protein RhaS
LLKYFVIHINPYFFDKYSLEFKNQILNLTIERFLNNYAMIPSVPKFYDPEHKLSFEADSCVPLRQAWEKGEIELTTLVRGTYPGRSLQKGEISGIKSIGYWDIKKIQDWGLQWHTNEGIEICLLESGSVDFLVRNDSYELQTNDLTITRPWIVHKLGAPTVNMSKLHWVILDVMVRHPHQDWVWPDWLILNPDDLTELTRCLRQNEQPVWPASPEIRNCFIRMGKIIKDSGSYPYDSKIKIEINTLFILLLDLFRKGNIQLDQSLVESKRTVKLFLRTLESRVDNEWTVGKMAEYCNLGVTRFTHYCKELSNCSPIEYLNRLRLRKASEMLLANPKLSVIDVAFSTGFSSNQYFNYVFKRHFKITPSEYRNLTKSSNRLSF